MALEHEAKVLPNCNLLNEQEYVTSNTKSKLLGLLWKSKCDTLYYSVILNIGAANSKRNVLFTNSKIFHSLDFTNPFTVTAKLIMQFLWKYSADWYEKLPDPIQKSWHQFYTQSPASNNFPFTRSWSLWIANILISYVPNRVSPFWKKVSFSWMWSSTVNLVSSHNSSKFRMVLVHQCWIYELENICRKSGRRNT